MPIAIREIHYIASRQEGGFYLGGSRRSCRGATVPFVSYLAFNAYSAVAREDGRATMSDERLNQRCASASLAERLSSEVATKSRDVVKHGFELIRLLEECRARNVHGALGLGWDEWLARYCELSASHVRRQLAISKGFAGLPTAELSALKESNAYKLLELPSGERTKAKWLDKAKEMPVADFAQAVDMARGNGKNEESSDGWRTIALRVPESLYRALQEAERKVGEMIGADVGTPAGRISAWEAIAALVNTTEREHLVIELKGE